MPKNTSPIDRHYHKLQVGVRNLFREMGIAA